MRGILLSLLFLLPLAVFSQNSIFKGSIVEKETTTKVDNAIITINGTTLVTSSDENGAFIFDGNIPDGDHIVAVSKEGYEDYFFGITVKSGKTLLADNIPLELTSKEKKKRRKESKSTRKEDKKLAKDREKKIEEAKKDKKAKDKRLAKERKKMEKEKRKAAKRGDVVVIYDDLPESSTPPITTPVVSKPELVEEKVVIAEKTEPEGEKDYSALKQKYARQLGVTPQDIENVKLYKFIDQWIGTPYKMGGSTKEGIDCSSFTQLLFTSVYDLYIERTAQTQYDSNNTSLFRFINDLQEGDLVFFYGSGAEAGMITHVGVYLDNKKFINATTTNGKSGITGVKISDLSDPYWIDKFCCGGARLKNE